MTARLHPSEDIANLQQELDVLAGQLRTLNQDAVLVTMVNVVLANYPHPANFVYRLAQYMITISAVLPDADKMQCVQALREAADCFEQAIIALGSA